MENNINKNRKDYFELVPGEVFKYRSPNLDVDARIHQHVIISFEFIVDDLNCSYE